MAVSKSNVLRCAVNVVQVLRGEASEWIKEHKTRVDVKRRICLSREGSGSARATRGSREKQWGMNGHGRARATKRKGAQEKEEKYL